MFLHSNAGKTNEESFTKFMFVVAPTHTLCGSNTNAELCLKYIPTVGHSPATPEAKLA